MHCILAMGLIRYLGSLMFIQTTETGFMLGRKEMVQLGRTNTLRYGFSECHEVFLSFTKRGGIDF